MRAAGPGRWPWIALIVSAALVLAGALASGLISAPIEIYDESRNVVSALEMQRSGLSLVTTFGFHPDLWNTKPPLLIWLMVLSARLFGTSVWALRVPSALAGIATVATVVGFVWRLTRSKPTALLAGVLLAGSPGFFDRHGVATADYDVLVCCFTTAYLCLLFFVLHRRRPRIGPLVAIGLLIAAAVLTKSVAGLIPGAGAVLYLLATRRWARPLRSRGYLVCALIALVLVAGYYGLRELQGPGYLAAVGRNELGGRYLQTIGLHSEPWWYYLRLLAARHSSFSAGAWVFVVPLALLWSGGRTRLGVLFALCIQAAVLAVFSASATKLDWYLIPAYPFMAIGVALAAKALLQRLRRTVLWRQHLRRLTARQALLACSVSILLLTGLRLFDTDRWYRHHTMYLRFGLDYGSLFTALHTLGVRHFNVVDGGVSNNEGFVHYNPQLYFYRLFWQARGLTIGAVLYDLRAGLGPPGQITATCDEHYTQQLAGRGIPLGEVSHCTIVRLR